MFMVWRVVMTFTRALHPGDVTLFCLCYGRVTRAALGVGVRGVLLEFCGCWLAGAALVALLPPRGLLLPVASPCPFAPGGFL